jgi:hypothetical protein
MLLRFSLRTSLALLLCLAISVAAVGQSQPPVDQIPHPSSSRAFVLIVVSAVAVVALLYVTFHKHKGETENQPSFTGCTEDTDHGTVMTDEKDGQDYVILPGSINLKPGEKVQVLAKKDEDDAGRLALQVGKLVKDYGPCKPAATPNAPAQTH